MQLDFYESWIVDQERRANQDGASAEVRWALADSGQIPLNPTLDLEYLVREYEEHYNTVRPHQGIANRIIGVVTMTPPGSGPPAANEVECEERLGGLLRNYYRRAA